MNVEDVWGERTLAVGFSGAALLSVLYSEDPGSVEGDD